jgi:2-keto-4-pentenoate hydratase
LQIKEIPDLVERLIDVQVILNKEAVEVDRGVGANVLGSPLLALAHLVEVLSSQPEAPPLLAGEIVTTGVITDAHPVAVGETWSTELHGLPLGGLRIAFL